MTLNIKNLFIEYLNKTGFSEDVEKIFAVNGLSLNIKDNEIFAIAGESGCGKSTLAKAIMDLISVKSGEIFFNDKDILKMTKSELKKFRPNIQMIFQNPYSSLNPKMKIAEILAEPLVINTSLNKSEINKRMKETIFKVGLDKSILNLYPHEFSGGQRQRIAIARALILNPKIIIADEPVSALDVSIQAQIINLFKELKEKYNLTIIFISHDLNVIKYLADRVAIMYLGEIVETGTKEEIFQNPKHPYTQALLSAIPQIKADNEKIVLKGDLPSPSDLPKGCKFHTRCPYKMEICEVEIPPCKNISQTHFYCCHLD